ncbi:hypothetical protein G6F37_007896 [Rhizopus arrhizus]|nr:hypothetical protein G6F38_008069 [Rhizopus arrhizus]KAG1156125.1 hypothetical protein G6F37_007896 [Rhizopus arrhizus]
MPGPATFLSLGAFGAAAYYANRRNSNAEKDENTPFKLARRRSSNTPIDHTWDPRSQPEIIWRRNNGVSFSHNSDVKFPAKSKNSEQTSK